MIHVDVMDGHFVPPITVGPIVVAALREQTHAAGAVLDVHLMIERPERHVDEFVKAGADTVTFHAEATPHVSYTAGLLREQGVGVGVAINPATPVGALAEVAGSIDMALCMTVNPGVGRAAVHRAFAREDRAGQGDRRRECRGAGGRRDRPPDGAHVQSGRRQCVRGRLGDLRRRRSRRGLSCDRARGGRGLSSVVYP